MNLLNVYKETITDGPGLRYSIYVSGCEHACPGCHNPRSWDANAGIPLTETMVDDMIREINANPLLDGITLSGGDPFYHPEPLTALLRRLKTETGHNIWCYTGYTIEHILRTPRLLPPLAYIDILVDGPFVQALHDPHLLWRGSSNQRIIRVQDLPMSINTIPLRSI